MIGVECTTKHKIYEMNRVCVLKEPTIMTKNIKCTVRECMRMPACAAALIPT